MVLQGRVSEEDESKNDMQKDMNDQETNVEPLCVHANSVKVLIILRIYKKQLPIQLL